MRKKKVLVVAGICVVVAGLAVWMLRGKAAVAETVITEAEVTRGTIRNTISSSGTVSPIEEYTVVSTVKGEILSDNVEIGKQVEQGEFLYSIDDTTAQNNITKTANSLEKQRLSYNQTQDSLENLVVTAPFSGRISDLYVEEDDSINSNGKIAELVDYSIFTVKLPFIASEARYINVGNLATVYLEATGESFIGTVEKVASGSYSNSYGALVSDIEITFNNPGAILAGESVTAVVGNYACNAAGTIDYKNQTTVVSKTSGTVDKIYFNNGDLVNKGDVILEISNDTTVLNGKSGALSLQDAEIALKEAKEALNDYYLTSPISGTIVDKYYKAGDTLDDNRTTLAVIADMSKLSFDMNIDELDIKSIEVGQKVNVTADALTGMTFEGEITNIGILGSSSNGVTTYPVTVVISEYEGLLPGMNVNAEIISEEVTNVLTVPVSAVSRGDVVRVKEDYTVSSTQETEQNGQDNRKNVLPGQVVESKNVEEGYKYIKVTTGLSDSDYIEIKEGLNEGDKVYIVTVKQATTTDSTSSSAASGFGMGGGMPMDSGGMPPMSMGNGGGGSFDRSSNRTSGGGR